MITAAFEPVADADSSEQAGVAQSPRTEIVHTIIGWLPAAAIGLFSTVSLLRTGVRIEDIVRYSAYWLIAVLLPGAIVARSLIGLRRNLVEDLSIAAITGISLEVVFWIVGVVTGVGELAQLWWVPILVGAFAFPNWRERWFRPTAERVPIMHSAAMAAIVGLILIRLDLGSFRSAPPPPVESALFHDLWWHLSLVQELMKFERPQVPQVAGEPLNYHFFAHVHVATGSRLSGVLPEIVLLRLWIVPIVMISVGLAVVLGRLLTSSLTAGVVTAWLAFAVSVRTYVWVDLTGFAVNPVMFHSPSQLLANAGILAAAIAVVTMLRGRTSWGVVVWSALTIVVAGGSKSTIIPILIAATLLALAWAAITRSPRAPLLATVSASLIFVQGVVFALASGTNGGTVAVLGTLKSLPAYRGLVDDESMRGINEGIILDSINSPRIATYALLALAVSIGMHACRLGGVFILGRRSGRADPANWWLSGAVLAGFSASMLIDHVGLSQSFFALTVVPLGAALTVSALWQAIPFVGVQRRILILRGVAAGVVVALLLDYFIRARQRVGGYGVLDRILFPVMILGVIVGVIAVSWRWIKQWAGPALGFGLAVVIGVLIPAEVDSAVTAAYRWLEPVSYPLATEKPDYLSAGELEAMVWLRDHSDEADVIVTNVHCRPIPTVPFCDARGFWVVGLSGRRAVMEGWAYTSEAQELQGVDGRVYARQPSPFVERATLNDAVFESNDTDALERLRIEVGAAWIVAVNRASTTPTFPETAATIRFDNGEVTILEIVTP